MSIDESYWNTPHAYYVSAAFLFVFMGFVILWMALWPEFWSGLDPLFSFVGFVGIFAPAGLGVFMVFLGRSLEANKTQETK